MAGISGFVAIFTIGFQGLDEVHRVDVMQRAIGKMDRETDFIIVDPGLPKGQDRYEDEGRSYHASMPELPAKVYVKLDDWRDPTVLSGELGMVTTCRYLATFMLAEEY